jgi:VIT1/CCC1 family predicted Fe2+/Mn2+ transporter
MNRAQDDRHLIGRAGWLRAAVLGANDGIISTASLILGVASAQSRHEALIAGLAGLVAGGMAMAAGEFVSVSSQRDTEHADLARERRHLKANPEGETDELAQIYIERGVDEALARQVAEQLMARDALAAHARDELGISLSGHARPVEAALASAATFATGAAGPLLLLALSPPQRVLPAVAGGSLILLGLLGATGAKAGGAAIVKPTVRVAFWGALAMALTTAIGALISRAG